MLPNLVQNAKNKIAIFKKNALPKYFPEKTKTYTNKKKTLQLLNTLTCQATKFS